MTPEGEAGPRSSDEGPLGAHGALEVEKLDSVHEQLQRHLNCVFELTHLIEREGGDLDRVLAGVAQILPATWEHPESTCARVVLDRREFVSSGFRATEFRQVSNIVVAGDVRGLVEVFRSSLTDDRHVLLGDEGLLLDAVAERVGRVAERIHAQQQLQKELSCVFELTHLIEVHGANLDRVLDGVARMLPASWQHPESTCSRVVFDGQKFHSDKFGATQFRQASDIVVEGELRGVVEVFRASATLEGSPALFLDHERLLLDAVAERVGRVAERIHAQQQLEIEQASLNNTNIALREILGRVEAEKLEIGHGVHENVSKIIMPLIHGLERELLPRRSKYVELIKQQLNDLASSFTREFTRDFLTLTAAELQVCHMIREGLTSKEIAQLRGVSPTTVSRQRDRIRSKLDLTNTSINLVTFLRTYSEEHSESGRTTANKLRRHDEIRPGGSEVPLSTPRRPGGPRGPSPILGSLGGVPQRGTSEGP
ncbi:MAG: hypothetical protein JKY65_28475 [Planctomycetes bacterium]|nr:hypothetical protein [Planctomycetota bacterium]